MSERVLKTKNWRHIVCAVFFVGLAALDVLTFQNAIMLVTGYFWAIIFSSPTLRELATLKNNRFSFLKANFWVYEFLKKHKINSRFLRISIPFFCSSLLILMFSSHLNPLWVLGGGVLAETLEGIV